MGVYIVTDRDKGDVRGVYTSLSEAHEEWEGDNVEEWEVDETEGG